MLVISMRSPTPSPTRQASAISPSRSSRSESPETLELRKQVAGAMLSVIPTTRPPTPKRPKLSLQTALPPSSTTLHNRPNLNIVGNTDSPTVRNTIANSSEAPPPTPRSNNKPRVEYPQPSLSVTTPTVSKAGHVSPFPYHEPYAVPLAIHGILRNSPLPKRHLSTTSTQTPKRMFFPPVKRVMFQEKTPEIIPTPVIEVSAEDDEHRHLCAEERDERRAAIEAEDGHAGIRGRRSKRKREWIWRPMPEDMMSAEGAENSVADMAVGDMAKVPAEAPVNTTAELTEEAATDNLTKAVPKGNSEVIGMSNGLAAPAET